MAQFHPSPYSHMNPKEDEGILVVSEKQAPQPSKGWGVMPTVAALAAPVAAAISYSRNESIKWAILSSFVATPYLVYIGVQAVAGKPVLSLKE